MLHDNGVFVICTSAVILNRHHHLSEVKTHRLFTASPIPIGPAVRISRDSRKGKKLGLCQSQSACAMCHRSILNRHHHLPKVETHRLMSLPFRSHQPAMWSQPDLARHQGSRRLFANGVKCMSNYSELSTYHEYGNIFPVSCTVFALQEPEVRTLTLSLETSLRLARSVD